MNRTCARNNALPEQWLHQVSNDLPILRVNVRLGILLFEIQSPIAVNETFRILSETYLDFEWKMRNTTEKQMTADKK